MAKDTIRDFSATASANTDIQSVNVDENCAASGINNAIRELMADLKDVSAGTVALETPQADSLGTDTISEKTSGSGVTIDGVLLKDGAIGSIANAVAAHLTSINGGQIGGSRNLIINGNMAVAQRGNSFSSAANNTYVVDRFRVKRNGMDNLVYDLSQSSTSPDGFGNSIKLDVTTAETSSADGEYLKIDTTIEAQNVQQLKYGTSSAEQITMSFWVRSSTTGTYAIEMYTEDPNKQITNTYTVDSANTFEYKTVTFVGDTGGSVNNDNGQGFLISWFLSVPSNYKTGDSTLWRTYNADGRGYGQTADVASTTGEFYITGVQLEVGSATPFEHEPFSVTLQKCQRYYFDTASTVNGKNGTTINGGFIFKAFNGNEAAGYNAFPVTMRAVPTITCNDNAGTQGKLHRYAHSDVGSNIAFANISCSGITACSESGTFSTASGGLNIFGGRIRASAEL